MSLSGELGTLSTFDEALRILDATLGIASTLFTCIPTSLMLSSKKSQHWVVRSRQSVGNKFSFVTRILNRRDHPRSPNTVMPKALINIHLPA